MRLSHPAKLLEYKRTGIGVDFDNYTTAELILLLGDLGWADQQQNKSRRVPPYVRSGPKIWYQSAGCKISKLYLRALIAAPDLFNLDSGITEIHHFQPQAYYKALLRECAVLPNLPLHYYKIAMEKKSGKQNAPPTRSVDGDEPDNELQEEIGFLILWLGQLLLLVTSIPTSHSWTSPNNMQHVMFCSILSFVP